MSSSTASPGSAGRWATREVDPSSIQRLSVTYSPSTDGDADPGEVVWTWVPYEENDGRGKDRPVLVIATATSDTVLAVQLTSKDHPTFLALGSGPWDSSGRPSFVNPERVFVVHQKGMRREAAALDRKTYGVVARSLKTRYGW